MQQPGKAEYLQDAIDDVSAQPGQARIHDRAEAPLVCSFLFGFVDPET